MGYSIAMFGAFNVYSYGDTMFPWALYKELEKRISIDNFEIFSPGGAVTGYLGEQTVHGYEEFEKIHQDIEFDAIIIGGGELLHNREIFFAGSDIAYKPGAIWKRPVEFGKKYHIPVLLNSVGMPYEFQDAEREELEKLCGSLSYISLRDIFSYKRWQCYFQNKYKAELVPDSLWSIEDYFSKDQLDKDREKLKEKYNISGDYIVLQYGTKKAYEEAVQIVANFAKNQNMQVVLLAINASHEDIYVVNHVETVNGVIAIRDTLLPEEIVAMISGAKMFVGTSLHGNLTATAFGVKNVIVDMYPEFVSKLDGFAEMTEETGNFVWDIEDLWFVLNRVYEKKQAISRQIEHLKQRVQEHFTSMCKIIEAGQIPEKAESRLQDTDCQKEVPLFRKAFFKVEDENGLKDIYRVVAENTGKGYPYVLELPEKTDAEHVVFISCLDGAYHVSLCKEKEWISEKNSVRNDLYLGPVLKWHLTDREKYSLICSYTAVENKDVPDELWQAYRDQYQHTQQLILRERNNEGEIALLTKTNQYLLEDSQKKIDALQQELFAIKNSKMYHIMQKCCHILDILRNIPCFLYKNVAAFIRMMGHVNLAELKIAWGYVCREGIAGAYCHLMRDYHQGELKKIRVNVEKKAYEEITDLSACEPLHLPKTDQPLVSIVIPAYNQFTYTYYCIKSIIENTGEIPYEVILADDCSDDLTTRIREVVENLVIARTEGNLRFLRNCNHAAAYAKGDYILFLNNDTQVQENWLQPLLDLIQNDDTIGMVGSKLVYADGTLQEAGGIVWRDGTGWNYGRNDDAMKPEYNYVKDVDYISGAAVMIRRGLWEKLDGFDERFAPAYYEDTDLAFQVRANGYRVVYQPLSVVVHFEGKSNGTDLTSGVKKYQVENGIKFKQKWKKTLEKDQLPNGQDVYLAKDRSQLKKRILVVDHYVPHYDKDAGGRCTYMYLKLFLKLGFKVTFIGDNFYQHEPYTTELTQLGIEILYGNYYCTHWQEWLKENLHYFDYIYLQRPHISIKYIDLVKQYAKGKIFYFAHDLHYLRLTREYELKKDPAILEEAGKFKKDEFYLFDKADVIHVVGSYEQAVLQKELPEKKIRNIPLYIYENLLEDVDKDFSARKDILFVGGFGHSPNIDAVLWFAREVYPEILKAYPDMIWHIVGGGAPKEVTDLASDHIRLEGFLSDEELDAMYRKCRLAVVPLRVGAGVKGKVVEAAYYQIPLVTTSIGEEGISNVEGAFVAEDDAQKMAALIVELYGDPEKLRRMSDAGKDLIRNHYMLDEAERVLKQDL